MAASHRAVAITPLNQILPGFAVCVVCAAIPFDAVVAAATDDGVVPVTAPYGVVSFSRFNLFAAGSAEEQIRSGTAVEVITPGHPLDRVEARTAEQHAIAVSTDDGVCAPPP